MERLNEIIEYLLYFALVYFRTEMIQKDTNQSTQDRQIP